MTSRVRAAAVGVCLMLSVAACGVEDGSAPAGSSLPTVDSSDAPLPGTTSGASGTDVTAAGLEPCPNSDPSVPAKADGLPDVTLPCLGRGPQVRLAGLRGLPMVITVWASYCAPCVNELPVIGDIARRGAGSVQFLGVDLADARVAALKMAVNTHMGFASVQDPRSLIRAGLRVVGPPTTIFVRPDGTVAGRQTGAFADRATLSARIEQYLGVKVT